VDETSRLKATAAVAAFVAVAVFVGTWFLLHHGFYRHNRIIDTPVYERYGNAIWDGKVPYRDFRLEYPPGALPMFAIPGFARPAKGHTLAPRFTRTFETLMWICGAIALCAMALVTLALRESPWAPLLFTAVAPLALGSVILTRFDLWPAALVAAAVAALVSERVRLGHALLGAAAAAKIYPAVFVPLAVAYVWKRRGRREALVCLAWTVGVLALIFLPFVVIAPGGVWHSVSFQLRRPLQVESLGASLLLAAHHAFGVGITGDTSHGSQNLVGGTADALGAASTVAQALVLLWIWAVFARGPATKGALVRAVAVAVSAFVAFGKVLSPQFLIWLLALVPLVRGRRGVWASALLLASLILTQIWFPFRYYRLALHFEAGLSWLLLARNLTLVALTALLLISLRRAATRPGSP
jgi:Glycosyltransferase family 87